MFLCLVVQLIFSVDSDHTLYAVIAAIVCMKETKEASVRMGVQRFIGTLIGGFMGYILINISRYIPLYHEGTYILILPLFMTIAISLCVRLKKKDAVVICSVVLLGIALDPFLHSSNTFGYVLFRIFFTTVGIVISTMINSLISVHTEGADSSYS